MKAVILITICFCLLVCFVVAVGKYRSENTRRYCEYLAGMWRERAAKEQTETRRMYMLYIADQIERSFTIDDASSIDEIAWREMYGETLR